MRLLVASLVQTLERSLLFYYKYENCVFKYEQVQQKSYEQGRNLLFLLGLCWRAIGLAYSKEEVGSIYHHANTWGCQCCSR